MKINRESKAFIEKFNKLHKVLLQIESKETSTLIAEPFAFIVSAFDEGKLEHVHLIGFMLFLNKILEMLKYKPDIIFIEEMRQICYLILES